MDSDRWYLVADHDPPNDTCWVWGPEMTVDGLRYEGSHRATPSGCWWWSDEDREANGSEKAVEGVTHWRPYVVPDPPAVEDFT